MSHGNQTRLRRVRADVGGGASVETAASVTEIAMELGYSSAEHFSGAFRRFYGLSLRAYRSAAPRFPGGIEAAFSAAQAAFFLSANSQKKSGENYEKKRKSP